jgi:hypothetical protein
VALSPAAILLTTQWHIPAELNPLRQTDKHDKNKYMKFLLFPLDENTCIQSIASFILSAQIDSTYLLLRLLLFSIFFIKCLTE